MSKVMFVLVAIALSVGLVGTPTTQAAGGPPCESCLQEFSDCLDNAASHAEEAECVAEFHACRLAC